MINFSGFGHYIEMVSAGINNTEVLLQKMHPITQQGQQNIQKVTFGEWVLIDAEVILVPQVMQKCNWTQIALHHHMLNESPKALF